MVSMCLHNVMQILELVSLNNGEAVMAVEW